MNYEWTPASEPPDTDREVLVWIAYPDGECRWVKDAYHSFGGWCSLYVTHWRDVAPLEAGE